MAKARPISDGEKAFCRAKGPKTLRESAQQGRMRAATRMTSDRLDVSGGFASRGSDAGKGYKISAERGINFATLNRADDGYRSSIDPMNLNGNRLALSLLIRATTHARCRSDIRSRISRALTTNANSSPHRSCPGTMNLTLPCVSLTSRSRETLNSKPSLELRICRCFCDFRSFARAVAAG